MQARAWVLAIKNHWNSGCLSCSGRNGINRWTKGWSGYFRYGYPSHRFRNLNNFMLFRLTRHLQRRSQRAYRTPAGKSVYFHLQSLGLRFLK